MTPDSRLDTLRDVLHGRLSVEDAARRHGVTPEEVHDWCAFATEGASRLALARAGGQRRRWGGWLVAGTVLLATGAFVPTALAQAACDPNMPTALKSFCAGAPAVAADINDNFRTLGNWSLNLQRRLGAGTYATGLLLEQPVRLPPGICSDGQVATFVGNELRCESRTKSVSRVNAIYTASRHNNGGADLETMIPTSQGFCFLTSYGVEQADAIGEVATCRVLIRDGRWTLEAALQLSSDADVYCEAMCMEVQ